MGSLIDEAHRDRGRGIARRIDCGTVCVNDAFVAGWSDIDAPMGGMGDSGLGRRHGPEGFLRFLASRRLQRPVWGRSRFHPGFRCVGAPGSEQVDGCQAASDSSDDERSDSVSDGLFRISEVSATRADSGPRRWTYYVSRPAAVSRHGPPASSHDHRRPRARRTVTLPTSKRFARLSVGLLERVGVDVDADTLDYLDHQTRYACPKTRRTLAGSGIAVHRSRRTLAHSTSLISTTMRRWCESAAARTDTRR
ncbi:aldehyde dehydrogenase family protein [Halorubrum gandharaense]